MQSVRDPLSRAARVVVAIVATFFVASAAVWLAIDAAVGARPPVWDVRGVALGMRESTVRRAFADRDAGRFDDVAGCDARTIEWTRTTPGTATQWARFEFHGGVLVAVRVRSDEVAAPGSAIDVTPIAIRVRRVTDDGATVVTVLSRDCPTHRAEVDQWIATTL